MANYFINFNILIYDQCHNAASHLRPFGLTKCIDGSVSSHSSFCLLESCLKSV